MRPATGCLSAPRAVTCLCVVGVPFCIGGMAGVSDDNRRSACLYFCVWAGWGYRMVFDMLGGCVPVIIQARAAPCRIAQSNGRLQRCLHFFTYPPPCLHFKLIFFRQDGVHQPGDDVLPYDQFAVRLPERDVDDLKELLEGMPPQEVRALQQGVHRFHKYFFWQEPDGMAYDLVLKSLEVRCASCLPKRWCARPCAHPARPAEVAESPRACALSTVPLWLRRSGTTWSRPSAVGGGGGWGRRWPCWRGTILALVLSERASAQR